MCGTMVIAQRRIRVLGRFKSPCTISTLSSETTVTDLVLTTVANLLYYLAILYVDRKFHWFDGVQRDDVTEFNERVKAREMAKRR